LSEEEEEKAPKLKTKPSGVELLSERELEQLIDPELPKANTNPSGMELLMEMMLLLELQLPKL